MESKLPIYQLAAPSLNGCSTCNAGMGLSLIKRDTARQQARQQQREIVRQERTTRREQRKAERAARREKYGSWLERNNVNVDSVIGRVNDLLDVAGGVANVINMYKGGRPISVDGRQISQEEARQLYEAAQAKQEGRLEDYVEDKVYYTDNNSNNFMQQYLQKKLLSDADAPKDNTALYIGLGLGGVAVLALLFMVMNKKS
ncbi:hypothetical protein J4N46_10570 [Capnocytophaga sp. Marseille-Q4570]|uniref:Uncharacterized protein n=1 Tax=Capnocytophaga bilenii TaxID=2819369 RepID=A0ABS3PZT0_9FLAO|nr:hypothetical protein [Capnocytophaga bilenii]MBO1884842.1 hypothetical protein [Capnocytophaga bilenii]